ncbi:Demethylmenaquinone methyltransferase [Pseudovibrio sp. Ad5]|uniref:class I SAM-dependent methyltransferase n=1 Tax=Pseudovibrio sp. Ad5 TaxID=989436 RepID=UPI0007AEB0C6|nr:methyltransferase domain-containing protein [Pseudovibrio sp. Ad5]KZL01915.1 Demethylmenaquinone methyltransferase [Pseudovibrio sp. Ad5]
MNIASDHAFSGLQKIYDQARPRYPQDALDHIVDLLEESKGAEQGHLLDVGCGTGILTRQLQGLSPGSKLTGCDVNEDMLSQAKARDKAGEMSWYQSAAEMLPFEDSAFHLITVAQAAQWFDRPKFYREVQRVLTSQGCLVIIENNRQLEACAFMQAYETLIETHNTSYSRDYRRFDYAQEMQKAGFAQANVRRFPWSRSMSRQDFVEMAKSSSKVQAAIKASDGVFLIELDQILQEHWGEDEQIVIDYSTQVFVGQQ